ncbi:MAG TPA: DUF4352 domain-containing protein [Candidatus Bathyarchaeia archaeon]|nr:DUF4352 domain-containing protein [Candidatus Bathyarchaeia archaeon]
MKFKKVLPIILILLIVFGFFGIEYIKTSPQFSMYKMSKAVRQHNYEEFSKYFDMDSVVNNIIDKAFKETEEESTDNELGELGKGFAEGLLIMMKPALKEEFKNQLKEQVETGSFGENYQTKNTLKAFTMTRVKKEGHIAQIEITNENGEKFNFKMRKKDDYWQVFDMDFDTSELKKENPPEEKKSSAQNLKFGEKADIGEGWFLTVNEPVLYAPKDSWDKAEEGNKFIAFEAIYENTNDQTNSFSLSYLKLKDTEDYSYSNEYSGKEPELESGDLEAGGKVKGFVTFEVPEDNEVKSIIYSGPRTTVIFTTKDKLDE